MDICNYPNCRYICSYSEELEEKKTAYAKLESESDERLKEIIRLRAVVRELERDYENLKKAFGITNYP